MINLLRSEWIKLRTVRMNWVLAIIAIGFPLVVTLLTAFFEGDKDGFKSRDLVSTLTGTTVTPDSRPVRVARPWAMPAASSDVDTISTMSSGATTAMLPSVMLLTSASPRICTKVPSFSFDTG